MTLKDEHKEFFQQYARDKKSGMDIVCIIGQIDELGNMCIYLCERTMGKRNKVEYAYGGHYTIGGVNGFSNMDMSDFFDIIRFMSKNKIEIVFDFVWFKKHDF